MQPSTNSQSLMINVLQLRASKSETLPISPTHTVPDNKQEDHRVLVAREIISSEEAFLKDLTLLSAIFHQGFLVSGKDAPSLTSTVIGTLFGGLEPISHLSATFLEQLKRANDGKRIGRLFLKFRTRMGVFIPFITSHDERITLLRKLKREHAFSTFLNALQLDNAEELGGRTLNDLLIHPVKRVPQYIILLRRLVKHTAPDHPDFQQLQEAEHVYCRIAEHFEERSQKVADAKCVLRLMESIDIPQRYNDLEIINLHRKLCVQDTISAELPCGRHAEYRVLAFTDCILLLRQHRIKKLCKAEWKLKHCYSTKTIQRVLYRPDDNTIEIVFGSMYSLPVKLQPSGPFQEWIDYLDSCQSGLPRARGRIMSKGRNHPHSRLSLPSRLKSHLGTALPGAPILDNH